MNTIFEKVKLFILTRFFPEEQQMYMFECVKSEVGMSGKGRTLLDYSEKDRPRLRGFKRWLFKEVYSDLEYIHNRAFKKAYEDVLGEKFE